MKTVRISNGARTIWRWKPLQEESAQFAAALEEAGYDVELIPFSGGHTVPFDLTAQTVIELTRE